MIDLKGATWEGKPLEDMSKEELLIVIARQQETLDNYWAKFTRPHVLTGYVSEDADD
jgi:hypothetical protein